MGSEGSSYGARYSNASLQLAVHAVIFHCLPRLFGSPVTRFAEFEGPRTKTAVNPHEGCLAVRTCGEHAAGIHMDQFWSALERGVL